MPTAVSVDPPHKAALWRNFAKRAGDQMLGVLGIEEAELSVLITGDSAIQALNRTYRRQNKPTDVLAFPMDSRSEPGPRLLGDVVISLETAGRQAKQAGHSLADETIHLLAHGVLHLVGYDHANRAETVAMQAMTARLVAAASHPGRRAPSEPRVQATRVKGRGAKH